MSSEVSIGIKQLSKKYAHTDAMALNGLNLDIHKGEIFGLLGPNGAGKTTFFSILCGLFPPSKGTINVLGLDLNKELETIKKIIGVVPQEIALYPSLSGMDNLLYMGRMYGVKNAELKQKVNKFLTLFDFDDNRHKLVKTYSGGMKRKINLIGGLLHDPEILLLDEPTVGLDVQSRTTMMDYLKQLNQERNMTILYTSHYLEQAEFFCDRVAIIDQGNILKLGVPKDLITENGLENLEALFLKLTGKKMDSNA